MKTDKEGVPKITVSTPSEEDWTLIKTRTEKNLSDSHLTVGTYIYEHILADPNTKVRGKLIHTIERRFYKEELRQILNKQKNLYKNSTTATFTQPVYTNFTGIMKHISNR